MTEWSNDWVTIWQEASQTIDRMVYFWNYKWSMRSDCMPSNGHWSIIMTMIISFGMQQIYLIFFKCRKSIDLFSYIFPAEKFVLYPAGRKWFWHKVYYPQDSRQEKLNFHWIHKKCILFFPRPEKYIKQIVFTPNFTHGPQCRYSSATWR